MDRAIAAIRRQGRAIVEQVDGFVRTRSAWEVEADSATEETYELRNDVRLGMPIRVSPEVRGFVSGHGALDMGRNQDDVHLEERRLELFEGYVDLSWKSLDARVGRQLIRWGKADEVNPLDNFTPQDLTESIILERADRKLPVLATDLQYHLTDTTTWEGIWIPFFEENRIGESDENWEFFFRKVYREAPGATVFPESRPGRQFGNSVWATRLLHQGSWADVSLSYAYHFDQNPSYAVTRRLPLSFVETRWERQHSLGMDFETAHQGWGVRGELVYTTGNPYVTLNLADDDLLERKDAIQSVLGVDYTYRSNTYWNVQLVQSHIMNHDEAMDPRAYEASMTYRLWRKLFHEKLKLQLSGQHFFTDGDFFYKCDATYELREALDLNVAFFVFEGESDGLFGQFDDHDQIVTTITYSF